ncbi:MAG: MFS transporter, partial [Bdellovibrio sp.]
MSTTEVSNSRNLFGHPKGLAILFLTEMWERFSYYGMRALLILYMTKHLIIEAEKGKEILGYETVKAIVKFMSSGIGASELTTQMIASQIYGLYTGFVYFTPFFGGILADRVLGQRKAVYLGGMLMAIGHFLMAIESAFLLALLFLVLG